MSSNPSPDQSSSPGTAPPRPALLGASAARADSARNPSILQALNEGSDAAAAPRPESTSESPRRIRPVFVVLGLMAVIAAAAMGILQSSDRADSQASIGAPVQVVTQAAVPASAPAPVPAPAPATAAAPPAVATLESLPDADPISALRNAATTTATTSRLAALGDQPAAVGAGADNANLSGQQAAAASKLPGKNSNAATNTATAASTHSTTTAVPASSRSSGSAQANTRTAKSGDPAARAVRPTRSSGKGGADDPDVALVTALMEHSGAEGGARYGAAGVRSPETIAGLVQACNAKPGPEGLRCRREICRGYWGKAEACPAGEQEARN
jgi:hypothetical protein